MGASISAADEGEEPKLANNSWKFTVQLVDVKERLKRPLQHSTSPQETVEICLRSSFNLKIQKVRVTHTQSVCRMTIV